MHESWVKKQSAAKGMNNYRTHTAMYGKFIQYHIAALNICCNARLFQNSEGAPLGHTSSTAVSTQSKYAKQYDIVFTTLIQQSNY
ncbi:hypothetical protein COCSUDRAFT_35863 [Coccomyxa subellipsoidea C-169]|uniref:Uncharacterized protein n=1 Tax=Coccomyxa subellipsoidea (strain C-169) TaxID=574566 RepID=I0Z4H7_COCSC|nr:hypothetical protein COCSUDRAFT_35863 [Coccomyxa subellipsoidea C-169]EIE25546.1 hypothetical protein COCSUDRAFT_35863 [Coccomyxa subellipsoidea C-169]|eukprot:XP_005650090.1 hypothetical protein COCSUDRAFT_35863 [Coccomyxa subellipsoidea C-169]